MSPEAAEYANAIGDFFTAGGDAKRKLGTQRYDAAMAADNRQGAREAEATRRMTERFNGAIAPLAPEEKRTVYRALNGEAQITDPESGRVIVAPHVEKAYNDLDKLRDDMAALQGDDTARRRLAYGKGNLANAALAKKVEPWDLAYKSTGYSDKTRSSPRAAEMMGQLAHADSTLPSGARRVVARVDKRYELPDDLKEFAAPDDQGILSAGTLRKNYLPGPREAAVVAPDAPAKTFNLLRPFAPNAKQRDEFEVGDKGEDLSGIDEAFRGAIANAARQGTAGRLRAEIGIPGSENAPADPVMEKLFERTSAARGADRTTGEKAGERWKQLVSIPKNTVTTLGLKHGLVNVPALAMMSEGPGAAVEALVRGAQLARKSPGDRYQALQQSIEGGVIAPFEDRENPIADALARLPGPFGKVAGKASHGANSLTWAIDDAAKQAVYRRKVARGMAPDAAAAETMREMVDYRHRSKATEALGYVAPFATFRSRLLAAIASGLVRHPERLLALDRASQGLSSNGKVDVGGHEISMTTPISDALELIEEPQRYARASLADPVRAALSPLTLPTERRDPDTGETSWRDQHSYMTYGQPLLPHFDRNGKFKAGFLASQAAGYAPLSLGQAILQGSGLSEFPPEDILSELLGGTLGIRVR